MRKEELIGRLAPSVRDRPYLPSDAAAATPSAVLVILHYHEDSPNFILTKRSSALRVHGGEISFPGGRFRRQDGTLLSTAIRETEEEIGISLAPEQVLGSLRAVRTMTSNHFIVPFVTVQQNLPEHRMAPAEVEAVIDAPLIPTLRTIAPDVEHLGLARDACRFTYRGQVIWGATARIMKQLYDTLIE